MRLKHGAKPARARVSPAAAPSSQASTSPRSLKRPRTVAAPAVLRSAQVRDFEASLAVARAPHQCGDDPAHVHGSNCGHKCVLGGGVATLARVAALVVRASPAAAVCPAYPAGRCCKRAGLGFCWRMARCASALAARLVPPMDRYLSPKAMRFHPSVCQTRRVSPTSSTLMRQAVGIRWYATGATLAACPNTHACCADQTWGPHRLPGGRLLASPTCSGQQRRRPWPQPRWPQPRRRRHIGPALRCSR